MFRRSIASAASVPIRQSAGLSTSTTTSNTPLSDFRMQNGVPTSQFDPQDAWQAFKTLCDSDHAPKLELEELFTFSDKLSKCDSVAMSSEDAMELGTRLKHVVEMLKRSRPFKRREEEFRFRCISLQSSFLYGDIEALDELGTLHSDLANRDHCSLLLETYKRAFRFLLRRDSPERAFEFFLSHINMLSKVSKGAKENRGVAARGGPFFEELAVALRNMPSPAAFLTKKGQEWDQRAVYSAGRLMLHILCGDHLAEEALAVYEELEKQGIHLPFHLCHELLRALVKRRLYTQANAIYASMEPIHGTDAEKRSYLQTGLYLHAHQGDVDGAEECFSRLSSVGNIRPEDMALIMHASAENGDTKRVLELFDNFFQQEYPGPTRVEPNVYHFSTVIYAYARRDDFDGMSEWFSRMISSGFTPNTTVYNIVMNSFAERGEVEGMHALLEQMRSRHIPPNLVTYTTMIKVLAQRRDVLAAEALYKSMIREGIEPDTIVVSTLMNAHVEAGSWKGVVRVFDFLRTTPTKRLRLGTHVFNNLLKAYVLIGAPLEIVTDLFQRFESVGMKPTVHTFALLVQSACDAGRMDVAAKLFAEVEYLADDWRTNIRIDVYILTIIMAGYLRLGKKKEARAVYDEMQERGIKPTAITYGTIIKAYANTRTEESIRIAQEFLTSLISGPEKKSRWDKRTGGRLSALSAIYTPLMNAYVQRLNAEEVERLYSQYLDGDQEPTIETLTLLLDLYRRLGEIDKVHEVWPQILELALARSATVDSFLDPRDTQSVLFATQRRGDLLCVPLSIYIDAVSTAGQHIEIAHTWNFLRQEGFQFDAHNWNHLVVALVRAGQPERAFEVLEKVILPYQVQARTITRTRSENITSPLLYENESDIKEKLEEPLVNHALRDSQHRSRIVKRLRRRTLEPGELDDFVHELHLMQQISPVWNVWRPHGITLSLLARVLDRLHSGRPIKATKNRTESGETQTNLEDDVQQQVIFVREVLDRIYKNYPRAVQAVQNREYQWQAHQERRREKRFTGYIKSSYSDDTSIN